MKAIYLVLARDGSVFIDSAWTTQNAADARITAIKQSRAVFEAYELKRLQTLEIRLNEDGESVRVELASTVNSESPEDETGEKTEN